MEGVALTELAERLGTPFFLISASRLRANYRALERGLAGKEFLVGGRYTVADCALYAYTRVAGHAGYDMGAYPAVGAWLERVAATPRAIDDLAPYPESAQAGAGGASVHDRGS